MGTWLLWCWVHYYRIDVNTKNKSSSCLTAAYRKLGFVTKCIYLLTEFVDQDMTVEMKHLTFKVILAGHRQDAITPCTFLTSLRSTVSAA